MNQYNWDWSIIWQYKDVLISGALFTLWISLISIVIGTAIGLILALLRRAKVPLLSAICGWYIYLFRALPPLVLIIWIYYALPIAFNIRLTAFVSIILALSLNLSAFIAETIRASIESIPKGQYEAGIVLGMTPFQTMKKIVLPQASRNMLPNLIGSYAMQLKNSSLASIIGINELLHQGNIIISNSFRALEIYTAVAVIYSLIVLPFLFLSDYLERRLKVKVRSL